MLTHTKPVASSQVAERFVAATFGAGRKPEEVFGRSSLPEGWDEDQANPAKYERGSSEYEDIKALAARDASFRHVLEKHGIAPDDPFTEAPRLRDVLLRKIRPVVAQRLAYMREAGGLRTRKVVPEVYSGIEVLYDLCEGNPRWLQNLLSELFNVWAASGRTDDDRPIVDAAAQARVVKSFADRFHASELYARPVSRLADGRPLRWSVGDLVDRIGTALSDRLLADEFPVDPVGAFRVNLRQPQRDATSLTPDSTSAPSFSWMQWPATRHLSSLARSCAFPIGSPRSTDFFLVGIGR